MGRDAIIDKIRHQAGILPRLGQDSFLCNKGTSITVSDTFCPQYFRASLPELWSDPESCVFTIIVVFAVRQFCSMSFNVDHSQTFPERIKQGENEKKGRITTYGTPLRSLYSVYKPRLGHGNAHWVDLSLPKLPAPMLF